MHPSEPEAAAWLAIRALFEELVELPREARAAALAARGGLAPALRGAVEDLLAADARGPLIEGRCVDAAAAVPPMRPPPTDASHEPFPAL